MAKKAAAPQALLVTPAGVLFRLTWTSGKLRRVEPLALTETLPVIDPERALAEEIARTLADEPLDTASLRMLKRAMPGGWTDVLREPVREIRLGHLEGARRRWGDRPLPKLPGPATPNDLQKMTTIVWRLRRWRAPGPRSTPLKRMRELLADHWFALDEVTRRIRAASPYEFAALDRVEMLPGDEYAENMADYARIHLQSIDVLRDAQRRVLTTVF